MIDVTHDNFNKMVSEGEKINHSIAYGTFSPGYYEQINGETYYQFKSNDNTVWWCLTASEIGFKPIIGKQYTLIYFNNDTTDCKACDAIYECECEVYDDIFLGVFE